MASSRAVVWFKRDLRTHDHAPLVAALAHADALGLYVLEPQFLKSPECDSQHVDFALSCLAELRAELAARGLPLMVRVGSVVSVLSQLHQDEQVTHLLSHEETGTGWSYVRDQQVAAWCQQNQVHWQEWPQNGVIRGLGTRSGWAARWQSRMDAPLQHLPAASFSSSTPLDQPELPTLSSLGLSPSAKTRVKAGERAAHQTLESFLRQRAMGCFRL